MWLMKSSCDLAVNAPANGLGITRATLASCDLLWPTTLRRGQPVAAPLLVESCWPHSIATDPRSHPSNMFTTRFPRSSPPLAAARQAPTCTGRRSRPQPRWRPTRRDQTLDERRACMYVNIPSSSSSIYLEPRV